MAILPGPRLPLPSRSSCQPPWGPLLLVTAHSICFLHSCPLVLLMLGTQLQRAQPVPSVAVRCWGGLLLTPYPSSGWEPSKELLHPGCSFTSCRSLVVFVQLSCQLVGEVQTVSAFLSSFLCRQAAFPAGPLPWSLEETTFSSSPTSL